MLLNVAYSHGGSGPKSGRKETVAWTTKSVPGWTRGWEISHIQLFARHVHQSTGGIVEKKWDFISGGVQEFAGY